MNTKLLGNRIKLKREQARLTQLDLASSLHITPQSVSKWERGETTPDISLLPQLSILLDVSLNWLLTGSVQQASCLEATVMVTSFRGFAEKAQDLNPYDTAMLLNGWFHPITKTILLEQGVPIKYMGDQCLAYFSGPDHQKRAFLSSQKIISLLNQSKVLVALASGEIYIGQIGTEEYAKLDIIGHVVNTAFLLNDWANQNLSTSLILHDSVHGVLEGLASCLTNEPLFSKVFYV